MKVRLNFLLASMAIVATVYVSGCRQSSAQSGPPATPSEPPAIGQARPKTDGNVEALIGTNRLPKPEKIPDFVHRGMSWLVEAQHENGGWGGGSHANQSLLDPHAIQTDPATTAFAAMTLLRTGHTPTRGDYRKTVLRATEHLLEVVESSSEEGPKITDITGTQPQAKLGPLVDTSMTAQFLARVLVTIDKKSALYKRTDVALDKCLAKLQASQKEDGSWNVGGGWAPVLQSSLSCTALELAQVSGKKIQQQQLEKSRRFQNDNVNADTGTVAAGDAAGVELYAFSSAQCANAADSSGAEQAIEHAKESGKLPRDAEVSEVNLRKLGLNAPNAARLAAAVKQKNAQLARLDDDRLLAGFGNNGGEEFLSYLMTSESLVISGGKDWKKWNDKMHARLAKVQNADGSWNGHHCISSPVFCTAAAVQCLTSDRDAITLAKVARQAALASVE